MIKNILNFKKNSLKSILMSFLILFCSCSATFVLINNDVHASSDKYNKNDGNSVPHFVNPAKDMADMFYSVAKKIYKSTEDSSVAMEKIEAEAKKFLSKAVSVYRKRCPNESEVFVESFRRNLEAYLNSIMGTMSVPFYPSLMDYDVNKEEGKEGDSSTEKLNVGQSDQTNYVSEEEEEEEEAVDSSNCLIS